MTDRFDPHKSILECKPNGVRRSVADIRNRLLVLAIRLIEV